MDWFLGGLGFAVGAGLLFTLYRYRLVRRFFMVVVALAVLGGGVNWYLIETEKEARRNRVTADDIRIDGRVGRYESILGDEGFSIKARIWNESTEFTVTRIGVAVYVEDCRPDSEDLAQLPDPPPGFQLDVPECDLVGSREIWMLKKIPPLQARDIEQRLEFPDLNIRGEARYSHDILEVHAVPAN